MIKTSDKAHTLPS